MNGDRKFVVLMAAMFVACTVLTACHVGSGCPKGQTFTVLYYRSQITEQNEGTPTRPIEVPVVQMVPVYGCRAAS